MSRRKTRKFKNRVLVPFEWLGIGLALGLLIPLPRRALFAFADWLSVLFCCVDRRGRRRALENLRILYARGDAGGKAPSRDIDHAPYDPTPRERTIIRRAYRNMTRTVCYAFWACTHARRRARVTGEMTADCRAFLAANKPAITVSGHIGCWEILSQLAVLEGHPMMSVAKDIGTSGMTRLLMRARQSIGQVIIPAEGAFRPLLQGLRDGYSLGLLVDQHVSPKSGGVWVWFFGRPMCVSAAPAFFAAKTHHPILIAWSRPLKDGRYRCERVEVIPSDEARDIRAATQRCTRALERVIRRHPSCWALNYNYFCHHITPEDLAKLKKQGLNAADL